MRGGPAGRCGRHRAALVHFVDRREILPNTTAALDHLDRCRACEEELEGIALAIAALRRVGREAALVEPGPDAWTRLRARIARGGRELAFRSRASAAALLMSAGLVGVLVAPGAIVRERMVLADEIGTDPAVAAAVASARLRADQEAEAAYIRARAQLRVGAESSRAGTAGRVPVRFPDGIRSVREEVTRDDAGGRPHATI